MENSKLKKYLMKLLLFLWFVGRYSPERLKTLLPPASQNNPQYLEELIFLPSLLHIGTDLDFHMDV